MKKRKQGLFLSAILILTLATCPTAALAAEPEESAEANEQEDEAAKETEEGEASDECTDNE